MTTFDQPSIDFDAVSEPISGETRAVVESTAEDIFGSWEWNEFVYAVHQVAADFSGEIDPSNVRARLEDARGVLTINPRKLSAFYSRAVSQRLIAFSHWGINADTKGRNQGKPARIYRIRALGPMRT